MAANPAASSLLDCLLSNLRPGAISSISPQMAANLCPGVSEADALELLKYLSRENTGLFEIVFAAIDPDGDLNEIPVRDVRDHLERGFPIHDPTTGEAIGEHEVIVLFRGTAKLREMLEGRH